MKWILATVLGALVLVPGAVCAQTIKVSAIGVIGPVEDRSPTTWAMSGWDMIRLTQSDGAFTPIMRSLRMDARTVDILCRTQAPPLGSRDIRTVVQNGHQYVTVRNYLLAEVRPQDARAEGTSIGALANKLARAVRAVLPQIAPLPNRFGV